MSHASNISEAVILAVLAVAGGCAGDDDVTRSRHDWPMARVDIARRTCGGICNDLELLAHETRTLTRHDGEMRTVQFLFAWGALQSELTGGPVWFIGTYLKVNHGKWGPLFSDSARTSQGFEYAPSLPEARPSMETWTFRDDLRGTLVDGTICFEAWDRAFGERPALAYPDL